MKGLLLSLMLVLVGSAWMLANHQGKAPAKTSAKKHAFTRTDDEWKRILPKEAYDVLRRQGTEAPYSGKYWDNHEEGLYYCAGCGQVLFDSKTKFESNTGWPSFYQPIEKKNVEETADTNLGMVRTEVVCSRCGGHLGHVFDDGPKPTGLRYCMNSVAMTFKVKPRK